ncbi:hypothetical protein [Streptomyces sp. NPDC015130]|uniref:hypothetical protein n=1 Tax=Streptomyces sp. NPDC015130 TaxID=3364940 RepID=UPI0036FDE68E
MGRRSASVPDMSDGGRPERAGAEWPEGDGEPDEGSERSGDGEQGEDSEKSADAEQGELLLSSVGCVLALAGVVAAAAFALPRAEYSYQGGFEGQDTDWSVVLVDVPLILLGGFALPPLTWAAATRHLRPWAAALVCLAVAALALRGLDAVWHPKQGPDPGYGPGL